MMITPRHRQLFAAGAVGLALLWPATLPAESVNIFHAFTAHIHKQVDADKRTFVSAQRCTEWFYKQQRNKAKPPQAEGVSRSGPAQPWLLAQSDCASRYPGGIDAAREDFSRTQTALSLSLTFYQYALVGDRDDDERYTAAEVKDIVESFGLVYDAHRAPASYLTDLNATFDWVHKTGGLESLMTSLGALYDKGYRLTDHDRTALNQISR